MTIAEIICFCQIERPLTVFTVTVKMNKGQYLHLLGGGTQVLTLMGGGISNLYTVSYALIVVNVIIPN